MNKNLKKVISAVAALALSASSFVAMAANYPDVDASASYKQAVDELSALKVIEGYEDGTFQPDKLVNRAEFSKMVITALGSSPLAQAEAAAGRDTDFADVKGDHWAAGYVTAAVSQSIINGMGDGTFAPDANITYAQAMKMLVCAAGYEQWSVDKGGWPDGYMFWGNQLKIGNGVKGVNDSTEITRAQCAQMIDNVLTAPVCVDTHDFSFNQFGQQIPKLKAMDGYGSEYQSILIMNHDAYKVKGTVTGTHKSGEAANSDEVKFTIQNARNWLDQEDQISKSKDNAENITLLVGDSDIDNYLKQYVEAIVQENEDEEYVCVSVVLAGQSEEVTLEAEDFDWENSNYKDTTYTDCGRLYFYSDNKTTNYKIDENVELYVNGVKFDDVNDGINAYVKDNSTSKVTLIDTPSDDSNSTDGYYDLILVDAYATMVVDTVDDVDTDEPVINGLGDDLGIGSWTLDLDTDDVTYGFTKDGAAVTVADLKQYDVLSIKYNVTGDFEDSNFYDVVVSDTQEVGSYTTYDPADDEYAINGTDYGYITDLVGEKPLDNGTTYTLYLDAFGRIAWLDVDSNSKKIAILDSVYDVRGGEASEAKIIFADGTSDTYVLKDTNTNIADAKKIVYTDGESGDKNPIQKRVVDYSINSSTSELTVKDAYTASAVGTDALGEYRANTEKLGSAKISIDNTAFINASDLTDIKAMSSSTLVDGTEYKAYAFDKSRTDSVYSFVIVLSGAGDYSATTKMAIYNKTLNTENGSGDQVNAYELFIDGEVKQVNWESGLTATELTQGDAILCKTNASDEIVEVTKLFDIDMTDSDTIWDAALTGSTDDLIKDAKTFVKDLSTQKFDTDLQFGVIVNKTPSSVALATAEDGVTNEDTAIDISYDSDCDYYVIDFNKNAKTRIAANTSASAVIKTTAVAGAKLDSDGTQIDWTKNTNKPRLALIKTLDKDATDVYVIIPKKD